MKIFIPPQNECFQGYPEFSMCVRPSVCARVSVCVQNTTFCQSAGKGIESHSVSALGFINLFWTLVSNTCLCFITACDPGTHGLECNERCSEHCFNGTECDFISGHCRLGCDPGYTGDDCKSGMS